MPGTRITTLEEAAERMGYDLDEPGKPSGAPIAQHVDHSKFVTTAFDAHEWVGKYLNGEVADKKTSNGSTIYTLKACPFNEDHKAPDSAVIVASTGAARFVCLHNSCSGYRWQDLRAKLEPGCYDHKKSSTSTTKPVVLEAVTRARTVRQLVTAFPELRPASIVGLQRRGEILNLIAPPKFGKSWLVNGLAIRKAGGAKWLDTFQTIRSKVLILDNELHEETSADRLPKIATAMGLTDDDWQDDICIENLRGKRWDFLTLDRYLAQYQPGEFGTIICDAFYRFLPKGTDENDNGAITDIYNLIDAYAAKLDCSWINIHHSSKGNQSQKSVTDIGAGAGAQSRATDTHLVLRQHAEQSVVVLDAAVRSWKPVDPICLRWQWPLFQVAEGLDPNQLHTGKPPKPVGTANNDGKPGRPNKFEEQYQAALAAFQAKPLTQTMLRRAINVSSSAAKELCTALEQAGEIEPTSIGKFDAYQIRQSEGGTSGTEVVGENISS